MSAGAGHAGKKSSSSTVDTLQPVRDAEAVAKFTRKLQRTVSEQGAQFISYHADTGEWKFKVNPRAST